MLGTAEGAAQHQRSAAPLSVFSERCAVVRTAEVARKRWPTAHGDERASASRAGGSTPSNHRPNTASSSHAPTAAHADAACSRSRAAPGPRKRVKTNGNEPFPPLQRSCSGWNSQPTAPLQRAATQAVESTADAAVQTQRAHAAAWKQRGACPRLAQEVQGEARHVTPASDGAARRSRCAAQRRASLLTQDATSAFAA